MQYWDQKDTINSAGNFIHFLGFQFAGGNLEKLNTSSHSEFQPEAGLPQARGGKDACPVVCFALLLGTRDPG